MKIGFIGAGKVGMSLGKYFVMHEKNVIGYYSKTLSSAADAANFTNTNYFNSLEDIISSCDILFLTVPDSKIKEVWEQICKFDIENKIFSHCSGAMSSAVFQKGDQDILGFSIHPMYAFSDKYTSYKDLSKAYFTIEGNEKRINVIKDFFESLGNHVKIIPKDNKTKYHLSCVFASNLVVALFYKSIKILMETGFTFDEAKNALLPLFMNNAENIASKGVINALSGPIERNDVKTVKEHLSVIKGREKDIYKLLSEELIDVAMKKDSSKDYCNMKKIIKEE